MEQNTVERICRSCGKTIQIPEDLEQFSCVYCGEKMTAQDFLPQTEAAEELTQKTEGLPDEADRAYAETHLVDCISAFADYFKYFNKKQYEKYFNIYVEGIRPIFEAVDRYATASADTEAQVKAFACAFLDAREAYHQQNKLYKLRKDTLLFESKLLIAFYMVPAIYRLELSVSEPFVTALHTEFMSRYPKEPFMPATYAELSAGFRKFKLCFITTAVCEFENKPDDCAELQTFRAFRDGWLSAEPDGKALIAEYYELAPSIVTAIDYCDDRKAVYGALRKTYLTPCLEAIQRQDFAACKTTYVRMVRDLQARYGLS